MRFRLALAVMAATFGPALAQPPAAPAAVPEGAHRWAVAPAHGEWMVCPKSFAGPDARAEAEEFAQFVRTKYNAAAFLYERGAEERQAQEARQQELRQERQREAQPFLEMQAKLKAEAEREGRSFAPTPLRYRVPKVTATTQWAVLIGGWPDMETASKALKTIRQWKELPPEKLLDRATISGGASASEGQYVNPFAVAMVCPNPSVAKPKPGEVPLDPLIVKLNENEPLSLLKVKKKWTLVVKDFPVPNQTQAQSQEGTLLGRALGLSDEGKYLEQTAADATKFAEMVQSEGMQRNAQMAAQKLNLGAVALDAHILHLRTGTRVTVGQFDSLDDPALGQTQRLLSNITFKVSSTPDGVGGEERRIFDGITPMPVPRSN